MPPNWFTEAYDSIWMGIGVWTVSFFLGILFASSAVKLRRINTFSWTRLIVGESMYVLLAWNATVHSAVMLAGDQTNLKLLAAALNLFFLIFLFYGPTKIYFLLEDHFKKSLSTIQRGP